MTVGIHNNKQFGFIETGLFFLFIVVWYESPFAMAQEVQVPMDSAGRVERVDTELRSTLQMFDDVVGFKEAYLFQLPDSTFALEIWFHRDGKTMKTRRMLSAGEAWDFRQSMTEAIRKRAPGGGVNQEGRASFVGSITGFSLGLYGWAIPYLLDFEGSGFVGTYLLISAGGIFITYSATQNARITEEAAGLFLHGSTLGLAHGLLVHAILFEDDGTSKGYVASGLVASVVEGWIGFTLADRWKLNSEALDLLASTSGIGLAYGWGTAHVLGLEGKRPFAVSMLLGSGVGLATGAALVNKPYTHGDVSVLRGTALLGGYLPIAALAIAEADNGKVYVACGMAGSIIGGFIGSGLVSGKDFTTSQGAYIMLGTAGGGLVGLALPTLFEGNHTALFGLSSIGAVIGFYAMYNAYAPLATQGARNSSFGLHIHPEGLAAFALKNKNSSFRTLSSPILSLQYRF